MLSRRLPAGIGLLAMIALVACRPELVDPAGTQQPDLVRATAEALVQTAWVLVDAGGHHSCALTITGAAYCWGRGAEGQLGNGSTTQSNVPVPVSGGLTFTTLSTGGRHTCGITPTGAGYCWGGGSEGELGNGVAGNSSVPAPVSGGLTFSAITAGSNHSCGITPTGQGYCWGRGQTGQLGDGSSGSVVALVPVQVSGGLLFTTISGGGFHTCAMTQSSGAYCWGLGQFGTLGDGINHQSETPIPVTMSLAQVTAGPGSRHSCGLTSAGAAYCWGWNSFGQIGNGTNDQNAINPPTLVLGGLVFSSIVTGGTGVSCGIVAGGTGYCWGSNFFGAIGTGSLSGPEPCNYGAPCGTSPYPVSGGISFAMLSAGAQHVCGLSTDGAVYCWGRGEEGQLGDGSASTSPSPVALSPVEIDPGTTPPGSDVQVTPIDETTGQPSPATITFDNVTSGGETTVTSGTVGQGGGPPAPGNFKLGNPPTYYDISTTAGFAGSVTICLSYAGVSYPNPSKLKLLHYQGGSWVDVTSSLDTQNQVICGTVSSLSPFLVAQTLYAFTGFFAPLENLDELGGYVLNPVRAGSTIPVKFSLGGDFGLGILTSATSAPIPCTANATADGVDPATPPGNTGLSYDSTSGQYLFHWKTARSWTGCRQLTVILDDGSEHKASFTFR